MKNSIDNQDMIEYAEEATARVAETIVKSSKPSGAKKSVRFNTEATLEFDSEDPTNQIDPAAQTIISIFDALESNDPVKNLEKLDKTNVGKKEYSAISTKIKDFVKSVMKFLTSTFTKHSKAELDKATEETVEQIGKSYRAQSQNQDNTLKVNYNIASEMETQLNHTTRRAPPPERKPTQTAQAEQATNQRPRTAPPPPPERKPTQTAQAEQATNQRPRTAPPPPPSPPPMSNASQAAEAPQDLKAAIQGVKLKNVADRKFNHVQTTQDKQPDNMDNLRNFLQERREKLGYKKDSAKPSFDRFAEDAKLLTTAKEELERQAKAEKLENEKVAKSTTAEAAQKTQTQPKPVELNLKPGEIPTPPPPPIMSGASQAAKAPQDLLKEIREGKKLKKVENKNVQSSPEAADPSNKIWKSLANKIKYEEDSKVNNTGVDPSEWDEDIESGYSSGYSSRSSSTESIPEVLKGEVNKIRQTLGTVKTQKGSEVHQKSDQDKGPTR